ncbi:MAG: nickel-dependent hydrogenase large subunit [Anaeromyxobacter sp.]|nr:nickel-dependent hydrogenase large subunit [Anaeromyxobacter sp.]MBL0275040.1 nickel-dependent hydrogenase large subunit [Anaeromyxobacter sp.]
MSQRITIDPITRIEGHLRIDLEVDGGRISKAYSSGTMWRGIEVILQGRDPRDAWVFTQRICGVCTTVHAIASVRSVESALGLEIPLNAQLIRNIIISAHAQHDHIVHFYHLSALDWVDVVSALKADPAKTAALAASISNWPGNSVQALTAVKEKLAGFVKAGQLGPFANGYWGHPAMKLSPEVNLLAVAHYLQALDVQRKANQVVAILGSKTPNIQNLAVGGVANAINLDNPATLNMERLYRVKSLLDEIQAFTTQVYLPDVAAVAGFYPDWFKYGAGVTNYLAVPDMPLDAKATKFDLPGGIIMAGAKDLEKVTGWGKDQAFIGKVTEGVARSYYEGKEARHPWKGETKPNYTGDWKFETEAPEKYSWVKSPRLDGKPVQVGPLAQVLVGFLTGHELTVKYVTAAIKTVKAIHGIDVTPAMLHSTLGRHAARAIRCAMMGELSLKHWGLLAENIGKGDTAIFNAPVFPKGTIEGVGLHEAPRGTLSHWCVIEDGKLKNYQCVVPSTWNAGPRDADGVAGPYEACLVGNPIADPKLPLEALRTIHSFDPCLACAIHTHDADGNEVSQVKVGA